jgi:hypothetical protein
VFATNFSRRKFMRELLGKHVFVSVGDNDFVCVIASSGNMEQPFCAKDVQTGAHRTKFSATIARQLREQGSVPNIELI